MKKEASVDYLKAIRGFDKSRGKKQEDTDLPLHSAVGKDGIVDYLKISREYEKLQTEDQSEVIHNEK